ncbi:hypothetical protein BZA70DRAFT_268998 [Myxozyma melibiosi]|uniref:FAD/NAD(P)-binding domain-containing protein n=1 Tax=Myxozyma melibiosi TaxID=54550 RepID=A0ABR1F158_9ASCO
MEKKEIVIVGGGMFGAYLVAKFRDSSNSLTQKIHITLVEPREDFVYMPLNVRNCIEDVAEFEVKPYDRIFAKKPELGRVVCDRAVEIDEAGKVVKLLSGEELRYDFLVVATGTSYSSPNQIPYSTHADILSYFSSMRETIQNNYHLIIIGGGATGCELAAEINDRFRNTKKVTLVHSGKLPLSDQYSEKLRQKVLTYLLQSRVEVMLKSKGVDNGDGTVTVNRKVREKEVIETVKGDVVFRLYGQKPATDWMPSEWKDDHGRVRVKPTFQINSPASDGTVFAVGDITDVKEAKTANKAHGALPVIVQNIASLIAGKEPVKNYSPPEVESIALTMGKWRATGQAGLPLIGPVLLPSWLLLKLQGEHVNAENGVKPIGY